MVTCKTAACAAAAATLLGDMSPNWKTIDPCTDFSTYVCQGLEANKKTSTLGALQEDTYSVLHDILESPPSRFTSGSSTARANFRMLQAAYQSCMDENEIATQGPKTLLGLLTKLEVLYPLDKSSIEEDLTEAVDYLLGINVPAFFDLSVKPGIQNPYRQKVVLQMIGFPGDPSSHYCDDAKDTKPPNKAREALIKAQRAMICGNRPALDKFEARLHERILEDNRWVPMNSTYIDERLPQIAISSMIADSPRTITVAEPTYLLSHLPSVLAKTSRETIRAWLAKKILDAYESYTTKPPNPERWKVCVRELNAGYRYGSPNSGLTWLLTHYFVRKELSRDIPFFAERIVENLKKSFIKKLKMHMDWLSKEDHATAMKKLRTTHQNLGYPTKDPDVRNARDMNRWYSDLNITRHDYLSNIVSLVSFSISKEWAFFCKRVDKDMWDYQDEPLVPLQVEAVYNAGKTKFIIPAAMMRPPLLYSPSLPSYLSYSGFGVIAAHELTHSFMGIGARATLNGTWLGNDIWWDKSTQAGFNKKAQCFIDQYNNFTIPANGHTMHVNGAATLQENLADISGLHVSYDAWKRHEKRHPSPKLPTLEHFSNEQLFFISWAHLWCQKENPQAMIGWVANSDGHSPYKFRILGSAANFLHFKEAFNCKDKKPACEL